jgi:zinc transport system permease protein
MSLGILAYEFFRNAVIASLVASVACGIIGSFVVVKRLVSMSGGLSHAAFGGIGLGYFLGFDPVAAAAWFTAAIALAMGLVREKMEQQMDTLVGVVWAGGMAAGILLIALTPGYAPDLFSYLFGNILLIPTSDLAVMALLSLLVTALVATLYPGLEAVTFDEEYAKVMNLPVTGLFLLLVLLIALTVVVLIRVVGIILVIALLTIPAAIAREYAHRLPAMMLLATALSAVFMLAGLCLSYYLDVPSGATIILLAVAGYGLMLVSRRWRAPA